MDMKTFAQRLSEARKANKLSQEELGKLVGLSRFPVIDWEAGRKAPDLDVASDLAKMLGVSLDFLVGNVEATRKKVRYFEELPNGSLVPVQKPSIHCILDDVIADNPDLEVWFSTQKLPKGAKNFIARMLRSIKDKLSAASAAGAEGSSLRAANSQAGDEPGKDKEGIKEKDLDVRIM